MSDYNPRNESYVCAQCGLELPLDQLACFGEGLYFCDACAERLETEDEDDLEDDLDALHDELSLTPSSFTI